MHGHFTSFALAALLLVYPYSDWIANGFVLNRVVPPRSFVGEDRRAHHWWKLEMSQTQEEESERRPATDYGFDEPRDMESPATDVQVSEMMSNDRLRQSLDDSAKFKIKNDARFTWLSTFLVSSCYAYGCLGGSDGRELLATLGVPNGGIAGGLGGGLFAIISIVLFFAPELFGNKNRT